MTTNHREDLRMSDVLVRRRILSRLARCEGEGVESDFLSCTTNVNRTIRVTHFKIGRNVFSTFSGENQSVWTRL